MPRNGDYAEVARLLIAAEAPMEGCNIPTGNADVDAVLREHKLTDERIERLDKQLKFRWITGSFGICRLPAGDPVPEWATKGIFTSVTRTAEELSIVCLTENVPQQYKPEVSWVCLKIEGPFAFSEVGILQAFIRPLVESDIPIFTISTFDTDYILIQEPYAGVTLHALQNAGHELIA